MTDSNVPGNSAPYNNSGPAAGGSRTKGITSLILGIVSLAAFFFPIVGLAGVAAIIVGILSRRSEPTAKNFALAGIILGALGFVLGIVGFVLGLLAAAAILQEQGL